jgi:hypothetical protein
VSHNGEMQLTMLHGFKAKSKEAQARKIQSVWPLEDLKSLFSDVLSCLKPRWCGVSKNNGLPRTSTTNRSTISGQMPLKISFR